MQNSVQVKSGGQVGAPVVSQLHGVMARFGLSKPTQDALKTSKLRIRVWQAADVVEEGDG